MSNNIASINPEFMLTGGLDGYYQGNNNEESNEMKNYYRNEELFGPLLKWDKDNKNIHNNWFRFRREIYSCIAEVVYSMETRGVENDKQTYEIYAGSGDFKWYNNEYTIYANGRDPKKGEKEVTMNDQLDTITETVYRKHRDMNTVLKKGETEWEGTLVGKEVAVDIAIVWDRNVWKSTAHLPEQGKFRGRLVTHAEVYAAVYKSMMTAINTGRDVQGSTKAAIEEYFTGHNTLGFKDRLQNKIIDKISE